MKSRVAVAVAVAVARGINPKRRFTTLHSWALSSLECDENHTRSDRAIARADRRTPACANPARADRRTPACANPARAIARSDLPRESDRVATRDRSHGLEHRANARKPTARGFISRASERTRVRRRATGRDARHADRIARAPDGRPTTRERGRRATRETAIERGRAKDARGDDDDADVAGDAGNRCG